MKMSGEEIIAASRETVWKALNDPHVLKQSIPGCESITKHSDTQMEARVTVKIGPVKAGFTGTVNLSDLNPPNSYRISGEGKGIAGLANGGADVRLEDADGGGTRLSYDVDAQVGGKLAMLGSRLIDSTARSLATQFFDKFAKLVGAMKAEAAPAAPRKAAAAPKKKAAKKAAKKPAKKVAKKAAKKPVKKAAKAAKKAAKKKAAKKKT
jgi:carbon monoxide dehydrogenase subunit G